MITGFQYRLANLARQHPALGCPQRLKSRIVFFDKLVKKGQLRAMALISRRTLPGFDSSRYSISYLLG
jgi:hypothetical protein